VTVDANSNSTEDKILNYLRLTSVRGRNESEIVKQISEALGIPAKQAEESIKRLRESKRIKTTRFAVYFPEAKRAEDNISLKVIPLSKRTQSRTETRGQTFVPESSFREPVDLQKLYEPLYPESVISAPQGKLEIKPPETITGRQCPKCRSNRVRCLGPISDMRDLTRRVRYRCERCGHTFSENV
jgi:DNA-directed RNA polymerase subunit M/transcription elongation factor TFIIS